MFRICAAVFFIMTLLTQVLPIEGVNQLMSAKQTIVLAEEQNDCNNCDNIPIQEVEHPKFIMEHHFDFASDVSLYHIKDRFLLRNDYFKFAQYLQVPVQPPNFAI